MDVSRPSPVHRYATNFSLPPRHRAGMVFDLRPQIIRPDKRIRAHGQQPCQNGENANGPGKKLERPPHDLQKTAQRLAGFATASGPTRVCESRQAARFFTAGERMADRKSTRLNSSHMS